MRAWFASLAPRERATVVGGGSIFVLVLVYLLAIEPAVEAFGAREQRVAALEQQLAWMRESAAEVRALRGAGAGADPATDTERPPYLAIDDALRGAGLPDPAKLEPIGDGGARREFDRVPCDPLMRVVARLRARSGLEVTRARIVRGEAPGEVAAQFTFERPES